MSGKLSAFQQTLQRQQPGAHLGCALSLASLMGMNMNIKDSLVMLC
jgi:hypothetical protein